MLEKLKSLYQRWKDNRILTSNQCQLINVKSTSKFNVETTLILGWLLKQICSHIMMPEKLKPLYQFWKDKHISTWKQRQLINVKSMSKNWRWNNVDFGLIVKTICFYITMFEKLKSLYQRWKDNRISTSIQHQFMNVKSTS